MPRNISNQRLAPTVKKAGAQIFFSPVRKNHGYAAALYPSGRFRGRQHGRAGRHSREYSFFPGNAPGHPKSRFGFYGDEFIEYAQQRQRWEPLQEIIQTKGTSESHPLVSPVDEFLDMGIAGWEYGNLTLEDKPLSKEMMPTNYLRSGLMRGLEQEAKLGVNPFKFGIVGSTDVHNSLMAIEEDNFFGKMPIQEPSPKRWEHASKQGFGKTRYTWHYLAAGYAAVWAPENTRAALWDAMKRREVYGTSGSLHHAALLWRLPGL